MGTAQVNSPGILLDNAGDDLAAAAEWLGRLEAGPGAGIVHMPPSASTAYLRSAVLTASPEQLQAMLYDGAIRFARQARDALEAGDLSTSCEKLLRVQRIVAEMQNALRHDVSPQLCGQLAALYQFVYGRLVEANIHRNITALDEALKILQHQRETWRMLMDKLAVQHQDDQPSTASVEVPAGGPA